MKKLLANNPADAEDIHNLNGIVTLTSLNGLLGSDK